MATECTEMKGERFCSALTLWDTSRGLDFDESGEFPGARFIDEIRVQHVIQAILEKPDWRKKLDDPAIVTKWKEEAKQQQDRFRDEMFDYALKELKWCSSAYDEKTGIQPSGVDMVWRSDSLLEDELKSSFKTLVDKLEASQIEKDWHPGSDDKVLNLVHPSLFCVVYGVTRDKDGKVIPVPTVPTRNDGMGQYSYIKNPGNIWSSKFQWLPAEFLVKKSGEVIIDSYINSLRPDSGLYGPIAKIFEKAVPLFNVVLTDLRHHHGRTRFHATNGLGWWDKLEEKAPDHIFAKHNLNPEDEDDEWEALEEWKKERGPDPIDIPEVFSEGLFAHLPPKLDEESVDLKGHHLQVIVKIGSIQLTPEKPEFEGGNWHIEGMANEKIVATMIYYYDSENIEGDGLRFRQAVNLSTMDFDQNDDAGATGMYGIGRDDPMVQDVGGVDTPVGRILVFPNIYQHSVAPFSLVDPTKPGHRKILVFFLVDPTQRIISSATIPPQGPRWMTPDMANTLSNVFPGELQDMIAKQMGSDISLEQAKKYRLELMEERSFAKDAVTEDLYERPFNLCEH